MVQSVPYSHHTNSTIVCSLTGKVVEGDGGEGGMLVALISRIGGGGVAGGGEGRAYSKEVSFIGILSISSDEMLIGFRYESRDWN